MNPKNLRDRSRYLGNPSQLFGVEKYKSVDGRRRETNISGQEQGLDLNITFPPEPRSTYPHLHTKEFRSIIYPKTGKFLPRCIIPQTVSFYIHLTPECFIPADSRLRETSARREVLYSQFTAGCTPYRRANVAEKPITKQSISQGK